MDKITEKLMTFVDKQNAITEKMDALQEEQRLLDAEIKTEFGIQTGEALSTLSLLIAINNIVKGHNDGN